MDGPRRTLSGQYIAAGGSVDTLDALQRDSMAVILAVLTERIRAGNFGEHPPTLEQCTRAAREAAQRLRPVQATALLAGLQRYVGHRPIDPVTE